MPNPPHALNQHRARDHRNSKYDSQEQLKRNISVFISTTKPLTTKSVSGQNPLITSQTMPTSLRNTPWHPLPLTTSIRSAPPLLLQSTFTPTSYTLYLTDLTSVWSETLSKRDILTRAEKEGTSIDPSEDLSQLKILLEKLQHAVVKQDDDVDLELTSTSAPTRRECVLKLKTTTELPAPLRPLTWVFRLQPLPRVQYTNLFVLPLFGCISTLQDQTESLLSTIKDKDSLIERLTDQLKEHNLDVKNMLGGGRARRRGLEIFDEEAWRGDYGGEGERRVGEVVKDVFGGNGLREVGGGVRVLGEVEGWWKSVEDDDDGDDDGDEKEVKEEKAVPKRKAAGKKVEEDAINTIPVKQIKKERVERVERAEREDEDEFEVRPLALPVPLMSFYTHIETCPLYPTRSPYKCTPPHVSSQYEIYHPCCKAHISVNPPIHISLVFSTQASCSEC